MQDMPVMFLGFPCKGEGSSLSSEASRGNSHKDWQVGHRGGLQAASYDPESIVNGCVNLFDM